jgi:hypothetical protein
MNELHRAESNEGFYETFDEVIFDTSVKMNLQILRIKTHTRKLSMLDRTIKSVSEIVCSSAT